MCVDGLIDREGWVVKYNRCVLEFRRCVLFYKMNEIYKMYFSSCKKKKKKMNGFIGVV